MALALTAMAAITVLELRTSSQDLIRVNWARQQLAATSELAIAANRFSEQIAELLLIGPPERLDFDSARAQVSRALLTLRQITSEEAAVLRDASERETEKLEVERLDRMQTLFREIDRAVERLLLLDQQGNGDSAVALFRSQIENRLDAEFERLIAEAVADERDEVRAIEADVARLARQSTAATLIDLAVLLAVTVAAGLLFARSIENPIQALESGTLALERGELEHRIGYDGRDEFGVLARRFDAMAEQLGRQRAMLVEARSDLERQVAARTGELADANRQLTAADLHRVRFLADISHELRTPLTALRGEAEVALRGAGKPESVYREALSTVVARAGDLARMVEDLLFLARSETDEIRFDMRRVELVGLVAEAVGDAEVLARQSRVKLEFRPSEAAQTAVRADPRRLKQALLIPLDNAIRYSDPDTRVRVSVRVLAETGDAEIAIRDQGFGMAKEDVPQAFARFYRGAEARERWDGGSGLGLSIARWIVEKHSGTIDLSSASGEGTEVRVRLPGLR